MVRRMLTVRRRGYVRKAHTRDVLPGRGVKRRRIPATRVKAATFKTPDKGRLGRTPKAERWFPKAQLRSGWKKGQSAAVRRRLLLGLARKKGVRSAWNEMQGLANVTADRVTKVRARSDAKWLMRRMPVKARRRMTAAARKKRRGR